MTRELNFASAINDALDVGLRIDERVLLLGEDIADPAGGVFKVTKGLSTKYGTDRVRATPIAETSILGAAVGASIAGMRPVAEVMFIDFIAVCLDQIVNHAAKMRYMSGGHTPSPVTIRTAVGSQRFGAQHAQSLEAWFMHVPGINVVMPSTPADAKGLLLTAVTGDDPTLFIESSSLYFTAKGEVPEGDYRVPVGLADVKLRGDDVTIVTYGPQVHVALEACSRLAQDGISAEVIDLRTISPLDTETILSSVARTGRAVVTHQATRTAGPGAEIASIIHDELHGDLSQPVVRLGAGFAPIPFSPRLTTFPTVDSIEAAVRKLTAT